MIRNRISALSLIVLLALLLSACSFYEDQVITTQTSPDGAYTVKLLQTGEPGWPFGSVSASVALYNEQGKRVDYVMFDLANDGGGVYGNNLQSVVWGEDSVVVTVKGYEEDEEVFSISYPKK